MKNSHKWYLTVSAIILAVISIAHLAIIIFMMPATVFGQEIPLWVSGVTVVVAGYLSARGFMEAHKM